MCSTRAALRRKGGFWIRGPPCRVGSLFWVQCPNQIVPAPWGPREHLLALGSLPWALGCLPPPPPAWTLHFASWGQAAAAPFAGLPFSVKIGNPGGACGLFQLRHLGREVFYSFPDFCKVTVCQVVLLVSASPNPLVDCTGG